MGELNIYGVCASFGHSGGIGLHRITVTHAGDRSLGRQRLDFLPSIFYLCLYITVLGVVHWGFIVSFAKRTSD